MDEQRYYIMPREGDEFEAGVYEPKDRAHYLICECYTVEGARLVADALNAYAAQQEQAAQVKALVEALRPLAAIADAYPTTYPDRAVGWEYMTADGQRLRLTLGDARKAAAALKAVEEREVTS